ncbi:MAG: FeoC-like transcriptional regulator [Fastidiosipilaceae bacterium]|jgi:hypothetical protein|nr:hypothetical protein [Clostridiaceae bacterium]
MGQILLDLLRSGEHISIPELATILNSSTEMVEAILEHYEHLGFVKKTILDLRVGGNCDSCGRCGGSRVNAQPSRRALVYWEIAEK